MAKRYFFPVFSAFFAVLLNSGQTAAQNFHWESKIDSVTGSGYRKILFQPEVTSHLRDGFADVRIYDKENNETPYLIFKDDARKGVDRFITYQIVNKSYDYGNSFIVVKNTIGNAIDNIVLEVNNADASRRMSLAGSYDGVQWFAVKDEYSLVYFDSYVKGTRKTTNLIEFDFPNTDYKFYKFEFDDWRWWWHDYKYPIFVVRAGYVEPTYIPQECLDLPVPEIKQEDDKRKKESVLHISFAEQEYVDHLEFGVNEGQKKSADYYRAASLYERIAHPNDTLHPYEDRFIASTILSSLNANEISLGNMKVKELVLKINNEDDWPLSITSVKALQVKHYLVSKLEAGNSYVLRYGCNNLGSPVYDMKYFVDKIPDSVQVISSKGRKDIFMTPVELKPLNRKPADKKPVEPFFRSQAFVWSAIALVILLLVVVTMRMLREMKNK